MERKPAVEKYKALIGGYFWLPCPCCGVEFGGHEWDEIDGLPCIVPSLEKKNTGIGICPNCTREGYGYPLEVICEVWNQANPDDQLSVPWRIPWKS